MIKFSHFVFSQSLFIRRQGLRSTLELNMHAVIGGLYSRCSCSNVCVYKHTQRFVIAVFKGAVPVITGFLY